MCMYLYVYTYIYLAIATCINFLFLKTPEICNFMLFSVALLLHLATAKVYNVTPDHGDFINYNDISTVCKEPRILS